MRKIILIILLFFTSTVVQAQPLSAAKIQKNIKVAQVEAPSFRDIPGTLTNSPAFTELWTQPDQMALHARPLLLSPKLSADDKLILVRVLQNVRWEPLVELYGWAFERYIKGQLSPDIVETLIFPSSDWNIRLEQRYQEPAVRKLLLRIQSSPLPQEQTWLKKYIPDILSGKAAEDINVARRDGQLLNSNRKD
jgi:hypothetical protein